MSLGKVVRNVLAGQHTMILKDDLALRLERAEERDNGLGAVIQRDGKLAFIPNYAGEQPVPKLQPYKEPAYVPFQGEFAVLDPNPAPKAAPKSPMTSGSISAEAKTEFQIGDRVRLECTVTDLTVSGIHRECAAKIVAGAVGELDRMYRKTATVRFPDAGGTWHVNAKFLRHAEAKPAFDPKTSPIQVGDRVKQVHKDFINLCRTARVESIRDGVMTLSWDGTDFIQGFPWDIKAYRHCFEIVERAEAKPATPSWDPMKEPLREGDIVEVVYKYHETTGKRGTVSFVSDSGRADVQISGSYTSSWSCRSSLKLIERPNT